MYEESLVQKQQQNGKAMLFGNFFEKKTMFLGH